MRRWRLDRNALRRRSDRAETVLLGVLLAVFLAAAPFAAHAAGGWTYASSAREAQVQQATLHHVPATILQDVPSWSANADGGALPDGNARWRAPDGKVRTGPLYVPSGATAGSTVLVWVTQSGQLADPPLQRAQISGRTQLAEYLTLAGLAIVLVIVGGLTRAALNARRLAGWDADWLATGPRWSPRR
jgi:hypothetical protein